jgi:hypothetical protein
VDTGENTLLITTINAISRIWPTRNLLGDNVNKAKKRKKLPATACGDCFCLNGACGLKTGQKGSTFLLTGGLHSDCASEKLSLEQSVAE